MSKECVNDNMSQYNYKDFNAEEFDYALIGTIYIILTKAGDEVIVKYVGCLENEEAQFRGLSFFSQLEYREQDIFKIAKLYLPKLICQSTKKEK